MRPSASSGWKTTGSWAGQGIDPDERFGPGSFGCHEAMQTANMLAGLVLRDPRWFKLAFEGRQCLSRLYQEIGAVHLPG